MSATVFVLMLNVYTSTLYDDFVTTAVGVFTSRELADAHEAANPVDEHAWYDVVEVPFTDYVG